MTRHLFGRYMSLKGAEKWSRNHHENWKIAYRHVEKFTDSKSGILFDLRWKNNEVIARKNCFRTVASAGIVAFSARHRSWMKHRSRPLSYSFDLQSCLYKYKRLACRVCGNALERFAIKFAKNWTTVVSLVFNIQNSIYISSSSARTFVSTGWHIKINIFVLTHSKTLTLRPSLRTI